MTASHETGLAGIEQEVRADGATLDEIDRRIAEVLGVPADYYFAYLLVWGAIEAHRAGCGAGGIPPDGDGGDLEHLHALTADVGQLAADIYRQAATGDCELIADGASRILAAVLELRQAVQALSEPGDGADPVRPSATGRAGVGRRG